MDKKSFQNLVRENIQKYSGKSTITKGQLKEVIKSTIRTILNEMENPVSPGRERDPEAFYRDAQDREDEYSQVREELEIIKQAGLEKQYESLMNGIFKLPIAEFDRRANALEKLKEKAYQIVGKPLTEMTVTGDIAPLNLPGSKMPGTGKSGWVSGKGGSVRGINGSPSGMSLTSIGKHDMQRKQDPVY